MALRINTTKNTMVATTNTEITPRYAGIGVYYVGGQVYTIFDNLLITINSPPWLINVTNVPINWHVVLRDGTGNIISTGVSTNGNVSLDVWNYFITSDGTLELYDEKGI
jgi:hypothetical protein